MPKVKTHWAIEMQIYGEARVRSLCNRSSQYVVDSETIESGANLTQDVSKVTCTFCRRLISARPSITKK